MSDINKDQIERLSLLSRIKLTEVEIETVTAHLKTVVDYIEQLQEVDVAHLTATSHLEVQSISSLREDRVLPPLTQNEYFSNAPDHIGGWIKIPVVMQQEG